MCGKMKPQNRHKWINLSELKAQIVKKLGLEESKQYFYYLNRFLSLKLKKVEFNKLCFRIIGRENIPLHNQFIHSILNNACSEKVSLLAHNKEVLKPVGAVGNKEPPSDEHKQSVPNRSVLSNGGNLSSSYQTVGAETCDIKVLDHYNDPGPNGKTSFVSHQPVTERDSNSNVLLENGHLTQHDIQKPVQHRQGLTEQAINEGEVSHHLYTNLSLIKKSPDGLVSVQSKEPTERASFENRKEISARSKLCAPLGVPSCPVSVGGARKMIPLARSSKCASSFYSGSLLDTATLRERMEQIAATQGLEGVPMDCANLLNNGLDAYLKGLIVSCIELVGARSGLGPVTSSVHKHQSHFKLVNSVRPNRHHAQSRSRSLEGMQERRPHCSVCLVDFRVVMELNPQQLGDDWPLLLEKICTQAFEE